MLFTIAHLSKAYGDNQVLTNVSLTMQTSNKWGLVGANGVGKSTLIKIIVGAVEPDAGIVELAEGLQIGYLPQVLAAGETLTLDELIAQSQARVRAVEARLRDLEIIMADPATQTEAVSYTHLRAHETALDLVCRLLLAKKK